jgi:hypothetical protein
MCAEIGLDPKALTNLLDRKVDFYDPMTQSGPAMPPPRGYNVSPYPDSPQKWPGEVEPLVEPIDPGDFAGASTTDPQSRLRQRREAREVLGFRQARRRHPQGSDAARRVVRGRAVLAGLGVRVALDLSCRHGGWARQQAAGKPSG